MDFLVAIVSSTIQAVAAFLGFQLAVSPPANASQKHLYKRAFIGLGIGGILVTGGQWWLAKRSGAELQGTLNVVRDQTKQPPQVTVNLPQPVVQFLPAPVATPASKAPPTAPEIRKAMPQPVAPSSIRLVHTADFGQAYMDLLTLHGEGMKLMDAAVTLDAETYTKRIVEWAKQIGDILINTRQMTDTVEMNSDVGVPSYTMPAVIPESHRMLYHNVWFRVYRLQQFLRRVEKDWLKNVVINPAPTGRGTK